MSLLFVLKGNFDPNEGGVQRSVYNISMGLKQRGHEVNVLSFAVSENIAVQGISVYGLKDKSLKSNLNRGLLLELKKKYDITTALNFIGWKSEVSEFLSHLGSEVRLISSYRNNPMSYLDNYKYQLKREFKGIKGLLFNNPLTYLLLKKKHVQKYRKEFERILNFSDLLVMQAKSYIDEVKFFLPQANNSKLVYIYNPFGKVEFNKHLQKENKLLFVGRMDFNQKRPDLVLKVWEQLSPRFPDWSLDLVGSGPYIQELKKQSKSSGLERIKIHGFQNPEAFYAKAKIFVMTSAFEGFGNVKLEAQSYGAVPVLFNTYSAAQELVNHEIDALLIEPFNVNEMALKIANLIENPKKLAQMSEAAAKNIQRFEETKVLNHWESILNNGN